MRLPKEIEPSRFPAQPIYSVMRMTFWTSVTNPHARTKDKPAFIRSYRLPQTSAAAILCLLHSAARLQASARENAARARAFTWKLAIKPYTLTILGKHRDTSAYGQGTLSTSDRGCLGPSPPDSSALHSTRQEAANLAYERSQVARIPWSFAHCRSDLAASWWLKAST